MKITKSKWYRPEVPAVHSRSLIACALIACSGTASADSAEWSGWVNAQTRYYPQTGESVDETVYPAAAVQLEYSQALGESDQLTGSVFVRGDSVDDERNLADIRELLWLHSGEAYQFRAGVGQVKLV